MTGQPAPERDVLPERHRVPLDVALARTGARVPHDAAVAHVVRARAVDQGADQHGTPTASDRAVDQRTPPGRRTGRCPRSSPATHQVRAAATWPARRRRPAVRGLDVVAEHLLALAVEVQPGAAARCPEPEPPDCLPSGPRHRPGGPSPTAGTAPRPGPAAPRCAGVAPVHAAAGEESAGERRREVTSGAPPSAAYGVTGAPVWANASRPHGKPPNGAVSRPALRHPEAAVQPATPAAGAPPAQRAEQGR